MISDLRGLMMSEKLNSHLTIPARNSIFRVKGDLERFSDLISLWEVYRAAGLDQQFYDIYKHIFKELNRSIVIMDRAHKAYINYGKDIDK